MTIPRYGLPIQCFTADPADYFGESRAKVEVGDTAFFEGRVFRTFKEFGSATTATYVIKAELGVDTILRELKIEAEAGTARVAVYSGGTEGGAFSESLPAIPANNMSIKPQPAYASQSALTAGGTHSLDGTLVDVIRVKAADNSNFSDTVGEGGGGPRGVPAATFYYVCTLTGFIGLIRGRWEEII